MWDTQVSGCFRESDLIFAGHPIDERRAFEWLADLRRREIGWKAARAQMEAFLKSRGAASVHITQQLRDARTRMKPWLSD